MNTARRDYQAEGPGQGRERDLVVAPNEYAYVSDQTKGNVNVHVGPLKTSLAGTDQLVVFDNGVKKFVHADMRDAIQNFATAPEGWYLVLKNPAANDQQPQGGKADDLRGGLNIGRKVNIPGPTSFALWPGQMVRTIKGHILRSNQYLVVRVYDEESAQANWTKAVVKRADGEEGVEAELLKTPDITMGKLFIVKGTEVSFYIPPTGVEVVRDEDGTNVRDALTLERLEYGILKDEGGGKRYVKGPDVVFPEPTEIFVDKSGTRKFKAIELSPISGIYIKVIADYDDNKIGDELFITGKEQMIYFPREEHAIMKYGKEQIHFATAIPAGEGRYVLNRLSGEIKLVVGPDMLLPDPRFEVLVRRVIDLKQVSVWFPGNKEALEYNKNLAHMQESASKSYVSDTKLKRMMGGKSRGIEIAAGPDKGWDEEKTGSGMVDDSFTRNETYTKPRSLTLDTKYDGAVLIDVWTGYAIKVVSKTGNREVIVGPATKLLEYDETLEHMELSMGTPKNDDTVLKTAYLRVLNNKVSDVITAITKDSCMVKVNLSYRVNFEGNKEKWFDVENYVKFLTDHMRSLGRAMIKSHGIEDFYSNPHDIIRNAFLGKQDEELLNSRPGRLFAENGMRIYEVEVLGVQIGDREIEKMLTQNQNDLVKQNLLLERSRRDAENFKVKEELNRKTNEEKLTTSLSLVAGELKTLVKQEELDLAQLEADQKVADGNKAVEEKLQERYDVKEGAELERKKAKAEQRLAEMGAALDMTVKELQEEAKAVAEKGKAITPQFIHALQAFADKDLAGKLSKSMSPLSIIGGESILEVFHKLLKGTNIEKVADKLFTNGIHEEDENWDTGSGRG